MRTGLSPLQRQILEILPEYHAESGYIIEGMRVKTILREMRLENTAANNASVSKQYISYRHNYRQRIPLQQSCSGYVQAANNLAIQIFRSD